MKKFKVRAIVQFEIKGADLDVAMDRADAVLRESLGLDEDKGGHVLQISVEQKRRK